MSVLITEPAVSIRVVKQEYHLSLGMTIRVSTFFRRVSMPSAACKQHDIGEMVGFVISRSGRKTSCCLLP